MAEDNAERPRPSLVVAGFALFEGLLSPAAQAALVDDLRAVVARRRRWWRR